MNYNELVKGRIFFGGVGDVKAAIEAEKIDVVYDVRVNPAPYDDKPLCPVMHAPIQVENLMESIAAGAKGIREAYDAGRNIYIHCGSGNGRASVMATAVLMELALVKDVESAEMVVKDLRQTAHSNAHMQQALAKLYK